MAVSFLSFGMACYGKAGRGEGSTHCGEESPQQSGAARLGDAGHGKARLHTLHPYGVQKCGWARRGVARLGLARQTHGISRGAAVCGMALRCVDRQGEAVPGMANTLPFKEGRSLRHVWVWRGTPGQCRARRGLARRGAAWQTHSIPAGVLKFAGNTNNERKTQWKTQLKTQWRS